MVLFRAGSIFLANLFNYFNVFDLIFISNAIVYYESRFVDIEMVFGRR